MDKKLRSLDSDIDFYYIEIEHAKEMCRLFDPRRNKSENALDKLYYDAIFIYVQALMNYLQKTKKKYSSKVPYWQIQEHLVVVPKALHNLLISVLQRKSHPIKYFMYSSFPSYSFAEVHPSYSLEISDLEKINAFFHISINKFYKKIRFTIPLLCISDQKEYGFDRLVDSSNIPKQQRLLDSDLIINHYFDKSNLKSDKRVQKIQEDIQRLFALSYLYFPRTAPRALRFIPLMAHEHFHRLISVIEICNSFRETNSEKVRDVKLPKVNLDKLVNNIFGYSLNQITKLFTKLAASYSSNVSFMSLSKGGWHRELDLNACANQVIELFSDLGGILLCGPAYFYALGYFMFGEEFKTDPHKCFSKDKWEINDDHPLPIVRFKFMLSVIDMSRILFYDDSNVHRSKCLEIFEEYINQQDPYGYYCRLYYEWFKANQNHWYCSKKETL